MSLSNFIDSKQTDSYYWFTKNDYYVNFKKENHAAFNQAIYRLSHQKRIAHIAKGFYIIIPLEYKEKSTIPTSWFIEPLMSYLGFNYYVSLLTAASFLGFAHQQPQQFQVLINKQSKLHLNKKNNIHCIMKRSIQKKFFENQKSDTGYFNISKKESLVFDLIQYVHLCGNLNNVCTIFFEIGNTLDEHKLAKMYFHYPKTITQRVGYLLDFVGQENKTAQLNTLLNTSRTKNYTLLSPSIKKTNVKNEKWHVIVNEKMELDL